MTPTNLFNLELCITLHTDLQRFQLDGSNVKAKNYNYVIGPALFSVPLDQVGGDKGGGLFKCPSRYDT